MTIQELQQRKSELESQLSNPEILRDSQKIKEFSLELSKIEKLLKGGMTAGGSENAIIEIRSGAGGEEAALFAG